MITRNSIAMDTAPLGASGQRTTSYVYKPLDHATQTIRLIRLQPALSMTSDIHCEIHHVSLEENPEYEALSYAWGDARVTEPIFLQDCPFQATVNLVSALRHLRQPDKTRTMWVDAICIDQSNVQERGHQVAFMATIYSKARRDMLWLGDDPEDEAECVFKFIQDTVRKMDHIPAEGKMRIKALRATAAAIKIDDTGAKLMHVLKDRPVWNRVWIIQEIVVAQSISIHCGLQSMLWDFLTLFFECCDMLDPFSSRDLNGVTLQVTVIGLCYPAIWIDLIRRDHLASSTNMSILRLWDRFHTFQATDPRDRIFALLGIATDHGLNIDPNYIKPASDLFIAVIRSVVGLNQNLDALCMGHTIDSAEVQPISELPTWVPDFSSTKFHYNIPTEFYLASREMNLLSHTPILSASDTTVLILFGIHLDKVSRTNLVRGGFSTWLDLGSRFRTLPSDVFKGLYHTGESSLIACARTFTGDMGFDGSLNRQSKQETEGLSRDFRSLLGWKGRLYGRLRNYLPSLVRSRILGGLQRRERRCPLDVSMMPKFWNYNFSITSRNFMAMIPHTAEKGDVLCVLYGSKLPHVLRKVPGEEDMYTWIGTAYVHGFMDGEAIDWRDHGKLKEQKFRLV